MTAKEKAIDIMSMYRPIINNSMSKECAIIHVKGIIEVIPNTKDWSEDTKLLMLSYGDDPEDYEKPDSDDYVYWQEVLNELNQM